MCQLEARDCCGRGVGTKYVGLGSYVALVRVAAAPSGTSQTFSGQLLLPFPFCDLTGVASYPSLSTVLLPAFPEVLALGFLCLPLVVLSFRQCCVPRSLTQS